METEKLILNFVSRAKTSAGSDAISHVTYSNTNNKLQKTSTPMNRAAHEPQDLTGNDLQVHLTNEPLS